MNLKHLANPAFVVALGVLGASALGYGTAKRVLGVYLQKKPIEAESGLKVQSVPAETASWRRLGTDEISSEEMLESLGTRNYLTRAYIQKQPADGRPAARLMLHMAYYTGMVDAVPHVPDRCFVGGGMAISHDPVVVPLNLNIGDSWIPDKDVPAAMQGHVWTGRLPNPTPEDPRPRIRLPRDPQKIGLRVTGFTDSQGTTVWAGFFFIANGGATASPEEVRQLAFKLTDDYAYFLKIQTTSAMAADAQELAHWSESLVGELLPEIMRCVPDWVEVERGAYPPDNPRRAKAGSVK